MKTRPPSHPRRLLAGVLALFGILTWHGSARAAVNTLSNTASITINDAVSGVARPADPYPSTIAVSGLIGTITKITVAITGLSHGGPQDVDMLLVGPGGQSVVLMSDNGGISPVTNVNLTFDDAAATSLPDNSAAIVTGTYKPSNFDDGDPAGGDTWPTPAPAGPYGAALAAFNGLDPNGTWRLFIVDDAASQAGSISGGWSLTITTQPPAELPSKLLVTGAGPGGGPHVRIFKVDIAGNVTALGPGFFAYDAAFTGGVNVALADLDGDGTPEIITAPGPGGGPHVKVFRLDRATGDVTPIGDGFMAYDPAFAGGVHVAAVDTDGDGRPEIVTAPGAGGGPHVRVFKFDVTTGQATAIGPEFFAYDSGFTGGVSVGAQ